MVALRRQYIEVGSERRKASRIEFHFPVIIFGIDDKARIVDFSLDGLYIQMSSIKMVEGGRRVKIALKMPVERQVLIIKAEVVYTDKEGIGCRFVDLTPSQSQSLEQCFNIFNATLPIE